MNSNHDHELEARIDRALKSLPPLAAPPALAPRVLAAIAARAEVPWHRRAWQTWPVALQAASFIVLLAFFGGLCVATWRVSQAASVAGAAQKVDGVFAVVNVAGNTLAALGGAVAQVIRHLPPAFICGLLGLTALSYALLIGLGAAGFRLVRAPA